MHSVSYLVIRVHQTRPIPGLIISGTVHWGIQVYGQPFSEYVTKPQAEEAVKCLLSPVNDSLPQVFGNSVRYGILDQSLHLYRRGSAYLTCLRSGC